MLKFIVVLVSIHSSLISAQPQEKQQAEAIDDKISTTRYVVGGFLGTTLGLGIGHIIQGRYWHGAGWGFTLSELYSYLALAADEGDRKIALYSFLTLKVAETISVWMPAPPPKTQRMTQVRYVAGGLVGMTFGFGSGHLLQGRWLRSGWPYTVSQALAAYVIAAPCKSCKDTGAFSVLPLVGIILLVASKVIETISLWSSLPPDYRAAVTDKNTLQSSVTLAPFVQPRGFGLLLAKSI